MAPMDTRSADRYGLFERKSSLSLSAVFGANVRRLRRASRITKTDFAKRCGVGRPYLDKVEHGKANPTLEYLGRFAAALDVDPLYLLTPQSPLGSGGDAGLAPFCGVANPVFSRGGDTDCG